MSYNTIKYYVTVNIVYKIFNDMRKHLSSVENSQHTRLYNM